MENAEERKEPEAGPGEKEKIVNLIPLPTFEEVVAILGKLHQYSGDVVYKITRDDIYEMAEKSEKGIGIDEGI